MDVPLKESANMPIASPTRDGTAIAFTPILSMTMPSNGLKNNVPAFNTIMPAEIDDLLQPKASSRGLMKTPKV